jgi:hypothetical protein
MGCGHILAKHLYFDRSITDKYDLETETGRRAFLIAECYATIKYTDSIEEAKQLEAIREKEVPWRYIGRVVIR